MSRYEYALITLDKGLYASDIREALADVFEIGVHVLDLPGEKVADAFVLSGLATEFERQNPVYVAGKSGSDLINIMLPFLGCTAPVEPRPRLQRTVDYWVGYMVAYFQMKTGHTYQQIFKRFPYEEIALSYQPLHEADDSKFVDVYQKEWMARFRQTRLAELRVRAGLSQAQLAQSAGVHIRSIQMYEQGNKDINHANGETLYRLSRALCCAMEDLLEL